MEPTRDDVEDTVEVMNDLNDWIISHLEKATPGKMAFILITLGVELADHLLKDDLEVEIMIRRAANLGRNFSKERWG